MITALKRIAGGAVLVASLGAFSPSNVECIAPADPGGGWDFTCRTVGKMLYDQKLVPGPVQVTNMPGGVGAVAFANVASKRANAENLLVATSTVGVTQIAQGKYPADVDTMRWLGMLGTDVGVVLVAKNSPVQTLAQLLDGLKANPGSVATAGSSGIGGWDHIRLLMLAQKTGVASADLRKIRWVQFDGGGPAVTQMMGGHVGAVVTDLGEVAGFVESGDVRVLAVLADERVKAFPNAPTAKEQGVDVTGYNWRGFYTGGKVSDAAYEGWVQTLKKLYESKEWQETAASKGLVPVWRGGKEFETFVTQQVATMRDISKAIGVVK